MNGDLNSLHTSVSNANYDIGNLEEFTAKMQTPEQRKKFYDAMAAQNVDLGDYTEYETKLGGFPDDREAEIETPKAKKDSQPDVAVTEENTASNGVEGSTDIPENDEYDFNVGVLPEVKIEGVLPEVKSEAFNFLQSDDKKEYNQNIKNFFNAQEEVAVPQLQKILGEDYEISESTINITSDPAFKKYKKGLIGDINQNAVKIKHKDTSEEIKLSFGIGGLNYEELQKELYPAESKKLFEFVNKTMDSEGFLKSEERKQSTLKKYNELNAPPQTDPRQILKEAGPLYVSQEEKDGVTSGFDAEDLFTPTTKQVNISKDPKYPQMVDRAEQPYEDELKRAKQELIKFGVKNPTQEEIEQQAILNLKQTAIQDIYDQKATDYMNSDEVEETDLDAILKLGGLMSQKINTQIKKKIAETNLNLTERISSFNKDIEDNSTQLGRALEFYKIASKVEPTDLNVSDTEERVMLKNGTVMSKVMYDSYMLDSNAYNKSLQEIEKIQEQQAANISQVQSDDVKYDLVRRNYNDGEKFIKSVAGGFGDIAIKSAYGLRKMTGGLVGIDNELVDEEFIKWEEASSSLTEIRNKYQKDIKFENAFSKKNIGRFFVQEIQNQAPIFATIATGPVGIGALGLSSAGENWSRMVQEDKFYGSETSLVNKMLVSGGYGAAEIVFDRYLTLPVMQRSGKALFGSMKNFRTATKTGVKNYTKQFGKRQLLYDPLLETTSEGLTTTFQNIITGRPVTENLAHSLFSGGMFGTAFGHVPFYKGLVMQKFSDYSSYSGFRTNLNKIADLQITAKKLNSSLKANKTKGNDTSAIEGNIETVNQEIKSLNAENESTLIFITMPQLLKS